MIHSVEPEHAPIWDVLLTVSLAPNSDPMTNFEWHTDDHTSWEDEPILATPPKRFISNRFVISLMLVALFLLAGNIVYSHLQKTILASVESTETELITTWQLINEKALSGDMDIFSSMLSGTDAHWAYGYQLMVGNGGLFDRQAFGLTLVDEVTYQNDIVLSPEMYSAEITTTINYAFNVGNGLQQTVQLQQPNVFRKGETRWLLSPPEANWWGAFEEEIAVWGTYRYPARDRAIVQRLMADINLAWTSLCAATDAGYCAADTPILTFSTDPQTFENLSSLPNMGGANTDISLPTPSLVGLPTDNAGYQALRAGYGRLILRRLLTDGLSTADNCCQNQQLLIDALTEHFLVGQGFVAESISAEQYRTALEHVAPTFFINTAPSLGSYGDSQVTAAFVWLDYFHQQYPSTPYEEMLVRLTQSTDPVQWMQLNASKDDANAPTTETTLWLERHFSSYQTWLHAQFNQAAR